MKNKARFLKELEEEKRRVKRILILMSLTTAIFFIPSLIFLKNVIIDKQFSIFSIIIAIFGISIILLISAIVAYKDTKYCLEALKQIIDLLPIGKITFVYLREDISNIAGKMLYNICDDKKINFTLLEEERTNNIVLWVEVEGYQNISNTIKYNEAREVKELESFLSLIDWKKTKIKGD